MSPKQRQACFTQISQLQCRGDRLLIMLDTNPDITQIVQQLELLHPEHAAMPYVPLTNECGKCSVVMVPGIPKPSEKDFINMANEDAIASSTGHPSERQRALHKLQEALNLKIIKLEDFFADQVQRELTAIGYKTNISYHASFAIEPRPIEQDLIYKPVADAMTVRQWAVTDKKLLSLLAQKGLSLPSHFNKPFLDDLRKKGQTIVGAEILVIEAIKN